MRKVSEKTIAFRVDEELHRQVKIRLAETGLSLKDYVISLIQNDLKSSTPIKAKAVPANDEVSEETVKEAQKVLDFVNDIIRMQNGKK